MDEENEKSEQSKKAQRTKNERKKMKKLNRSRAEELISEYGLDQTKTKKKLLNLVKEEVKQRKMIEYGSNNLAAGPDIYDADEVILVEGRADVINLMRMGIDNTIAVEGTNVPNNVIHLCNTRNVTALLDGDRGGDSILKELILKTKIKYVARAPEGKEVEHLTMEEVQQALNELKKPILDAEFIREKISLIDFIKRNNQYSKFKKLIY